MSVSLVLAACAALVSVLPLADRFEADRLFSSQRYAEAGAAYEAYLAENPDDGLAWFRCGFAWHAVGDLDRAIDAGYTGAAQTQADSDLVALHDDPRWPALIERLRAGAAEGPETLMHFWIGEWDVHTVGGVLAGHNTLTLHDGGAMHERWIGNGANNTGESWNYWDPARKAGVQIWIDAAGSVTEFVGTPKDEGSGG